MLITSALISILTVTIAIIGWFLKRHIEDVEKSIRELKVGLAIVKQDIIWIKNNVEDIKSIANENSIYFSDNVNKINAKLEGIKDHGQDMSNQLNEHEKHLENYGKIIRVMSRKN